MFTGSRKRVLDRYIYPTGLGSGTHTVKVYTVYNTYTDGTDVYGVPFLTGDKITFTLQ